MGIKSLKHDTVLVLRPNPADGGYRKWSKPSRVEATSSERFCRDCGTALGWFLETEIGEENIRREWKRLIGEDYNGKASG
jgi:hypothetical protein